ncbi:MAG: hypothetical protein A2233_03440 [Candidatus Kerfeldbacteria bacterium RIFOXYA2_FULL_38_24]|nr:MAG: hypothetical protein A2272_01470 [Candidatus Peregrinibacteria bacterium RIFOXYA12_FULL_33_12]OGY86460.1 MAG: hypothetical protein A2233_03440 [Candidatus Kerfeldbacteria bacterium RIFOXYA2_FULL_38_24]
MRLQMWHVDSFKSKITKKGHSSILENPEPKEISVGEALLVFISVEKNDPANADAVLDKASNEIAALLQKVGVNTVVIHPFAHLFAELADTQLSVDILKLLERRLVEKNLKVIRTPFGWFNELEIKAKGHPLSRVSRIINVDK